MIPALEEKEIESPQSGFRRMRSGAAKLANGLSKFFKALWLYIAGVFAVAVIYYLFTGVEQGIDVVIQSGEHILPGILTVVSVFVWAFLLWYSCRMLSYIRQRKDDELFDPAEPTSPYLYKKYCIPASLHRHIPRMLAYNCFVSVQVAIFNLPTFEVISPAKWRWAEMLVIIFLHNAFYFLLTGWFENENPAAKRKTKIKWICIITIIGYMAFLIYHIVRFSANDLTEGPLRHPFWLAIMALVIFVLQVLTVFFFVFRRRKVDEAVASDKPFRRLKLMDSLKLNPRFKNTEAQAFIIFHGVAAVAALLYFLSLFTFDFAAIIGPMAFALLALGILSGLANFITMWSIRASFNIFIILYAWAFILGLFREPYKVRLLENKGRTKIFSERPDTQAYLKDWFNGKLPLLQSDPEKPFPVYIILSNGGASRAGKWTSDVLSHIQDATFDQQQPDNSFKDHILCIAGASGGTVGNCVFYSLMKAEAEGRIAPNEFQKHSNTFFETDFLTYTLARLLGPDIFGHISPLQVIPDRAAALEDVISNGSADELLNEYFNRKVSDVFDATGKLPILFINATQVDNGMPGVISSVQLPESTQRTDILTLIDNMKNEKRADLKLSTAAVLSSRFPYVSPAGKISDRYFVDGGYFDNSGAGTVLEFIYELEKFFNDPANDSIAQHRDRFIFHIVHITNSEQKQKPAKDIHPLTNDLLAPVLTLAGMQGSSTSIGNGVLLNAFKEFNQDEDALITYSLYDASWPEEKIRAGEYEEGYPMSWVISNYQLNRMKIALDSANSKNLEKFEF